MLIAFFTFTAPVLALQVAQMIKQYLDGRKLSAAATAIPAAAQQVSDKVTENSAKLDEAAAKLVVAENKAEVREQKLDQVHTLVNGGFTEERERRITAEARCDSLVAQLRGVGVEPDDEQG